METKAFPTDTTADIVWSEDFLGVADIESAFNTARSTENSQLGNSVPMLFEKSLKG